MWILFGALSVVFTLMHFYFGIKRKKTAPWAALCAVSFTALTMLAQYSIVWRFVKQEDLSALMDVVPTMYMGLAGYVLFIIIANAFISLFYRK